MGTRHQHDFWQLMLLDLGFYWPGIILMVILLSSLCGNCCRCGCGTKSMILSTAINGLIGAVVFPGYYAIKLTSNTNKVLQAATFGFLQVDTSRVGWEIFSHLTFRNLAFLLTIGIYVMQIVLAFSLEKE